MEGGWRKGNNKKTEQTKKKHSKIHDNKERLLERRVKVYVETTGGSDHPEKRPKTPRQEIA